MSFPNRQIVLRRAIEEARELTNIQDRQRNKFCGGAPCCALRDRFRLFASELFTRNTSHAHQFSAENLTQASINQQHTSTHVSSNLLPNA